MFFFLDVLLGRVWRVLEAEGWATRAGAWVRTHSLLSPVEWGLVLGGQEGALRHLNVRGGVRFFSFCNSRDGTQGLVSAEQVAVSLNAARAPHACIRPLPSPPLFSLLFTFCIILFLNVEISFQ